MECNCVIIRIWFCKHDGGIGVGHASLETPNEYLSLWPGKATNAKTFGGMLFEHRPDVHFSFCYQEDLETENRPPDYICPLYSLNVLEIDRTIHKIKLETNQWSAAGNTVFGNWTGGTSRSCSGAVHEALIAGGMRVLTNAGLLTNLMTSPHNIFTWARRAKKEELRKYPLTNKYDASQGFEYNSHPEVSTMAIFQALKGKK